MNERANIGILAAVLAALCCGGPPLVGLALGTAWTAGLLAWFTQSAYFVVPALFIALGLGPVENQDSPWRLGVIQAFDG